MADADRHCTACGCALPEGRDYCPRCGASGVSAAGTDGEGLDDQERGGDEFDSPGEGWLAALGADRERVGWIAPGSRPDRVVTGAVGVLGGLLAGLLVLAALLVAWGGAAGYVLSAFAWLGATAYLGTRPSLYVAVRHAGALVAALLAVLPAAFLSPFGPVPAAERVDLFLAGLVPLVPLAALVAGVGYHVGRYDPRE